MFRRLFPPAKKDYGRPFLTDAYYLIFLPDSSRSYSCVENARIRINVVSDGYVSYLRTLLFVVHNPIWANVIL